MLDYDPHHLIVKELVHLAGVEAGFERLLRAYTGNTLDERFRATLLTARRRRPTRIEYLRGIVATLNPASLDDELDAAPLGALLQCYTREDSFPDLHSELFAAGFAVRSQRYVLGCYKVLTSFSDLSLVDHVVRLRQFVQEEEHTARELDDHCRRLWQALYRR